MSRTDWFAFGGVLVSCLALGVSLLALWLQARTQKSDQEKELADQIDAIQMQMAQLRQSSPSGRPMDMIANTSNVNAALQGLVLRVAALINSAKLEPDWFQTLVLAMAFSQVLDMAGAEPYMDRAVALARAEAIESLHLAQPRGAGSASMIVSLRMRAAFYFNRALEGDYDRARRDFDEARQDVVNSQDRQGPHASRAQTIELYIRQADLELDIGNVDKAADLTGEAFAEWQRIEAPAARQQCGIILATFAFSQSIVAPEALHLPRAFLIESADLLRKSQADAPTPPPPDLTGLNPINFGTHPTEHPPAG